MTNIITLMDADKLETIGRLHAGQMFHYVNCNEIYMKLENEQIVQLKNGRNFFPQPSTQIIPVNNVMIRKARCD
jgi:hypothetical protein